MNQNGEILNEATLTVKGTAPGNFIGKVLNIFDSNFQLSLTGFPEITKEDDADTFSSQRSVSQYSIHTTKVTFNSTGTGPIPTEDLTSFTFYTVFVTGEKEFVSCKVEVSDSNDTLYFLCAGTPEEAQERFQELNLGTSN